MAEFDLELEDINPILDLVLFENVESEYPRDRPLSLIYSLGKEFKPSHQEDWIGIFRSGWNSVRDCLVQKWASSTRRHHEKSRRSVLFDESDFNEFVNNVDDYQFLYVTKGENIVGVSNTFRFTGRDVRCTDVISIASSENSVQNSSSISFEDIQLECSEIQDIPGFHGDLCFDKLEELVLKASEQTGNKIEESKVPDEDTFGLVELFTEPSGSFPCRKRSLSDTFEIVDENIAPEVRNRTKTKQKVLTVVRDTESLKVEFPEKPWNEKLRIVQVMCPIVQEYIDNKERSVVPLKAHSVIPVAPLKPIYDVNKKAKVSQLSEETMKALVNTEQPKLEFPLRLSLLPGPKSILEGMKDSSKNCRACAMGIDLVSDYICRHNVTLDKVAEMRKEIQELKSVIKDNNIKNLLTSFQKVGGANVYGGYIEEVVKQNRNLQSTVAELQNQLKTQKGNKPCGKSPKESINRTTCNPKESINKPTCNPEESINKPMYNPEDCVKDAILILSKRGYKGVINPEGKHVDLQDLSSSSSDEDEIWQIRSPKRIERLRTIIAKQDATIENTNAAVNTQRNVLKKKTKIIRALRKETARTEAKNEELTKKLNDMTIRIRGILRGRAKELTNEWRMLARTIRDEPYIDPINSRTADFPVLGSTSKLPVPKKRCTQVNTVSSDVKYIRSTVTKTCSTCGVTFTPEVDPRVYEEHMVFHERYQKKFS